MAMPTIFERIFRRLDPVPVAPATPPPTLAPAATPTPAPIIAPITAPITMQAASEAWIVYLKTRKRSPAKPASIATFQSFVRTHINPRLGNMPVGSVGVAVLRNFIAELADANLSSKTQVEIASVVKQIVASVCNGDGEQLFPKKWDNNKLDLPIVNAADQHTPLASRKQIESAIANSEPMYGCLFALTAGSGMRIGELRSIKLGEDGVSTVFDSSNAIVRVRRSVWQNLEQTPKTPASVRDVLIPYNLASYIAEFAGKRTGFLFGNDPSAPISESTARGHLTDSGLPGFHSLRRFFVSHRRAMAMPNDIIKALVGHASSDITDRYNRFGRNPAYAAQIRAEVERAGLGFTLPGGHDDHQHQRQ
jgi:integrase